MAELTPLNTVSTADLAAALAAQLSDSIPLAATATGSAGASQTVAHGDHAHKHAPGVGYDIGQFTTHMTVISSGTVDGSGLFTGLTALVSAPPGVVYVYVAAGIGLAAGWYLATWVSTTSCQLAGAPATTAGAYAGVTPNVFIDVTPAQVTLPANSLGLTGRLSTLLRATANNNANAKIAGLFLGTATVQAISLTTGLVQGIFAAIRNQNSLTSQKCYQYNGEFSNGPTSYYTLDTRTDLVILPAIKLVTSAADTMSIIVAEYTVVPSLT